MITLTNRFRLNWIFYQFSCQEASNIFTPLLSRLGLKTRPPHDFRYSIAQNQEGVAISEPHESRRNRQNSARLISSRIESVEELICNFGLDHGSGSFENNGEEIDNGGRLNTMISVLQQLQ